MTVIVKKLLNPDYVDNSANAAFELEVPNGVHAVTVGGRTFVYIAGDGDSGISGFELGVNGSLTSVANVDDTPGLAFSGTATLTSATVGANTYLYVSSSFGSGVSAFRVEADGTLTNVDDLAKSPAQ